MFSYANPTTRESITAARDDVFLFFAPHGGRVVRVDVYANVAPASGAGLRLRTDDDAQPLAVTLAAGARTASVATDRQIAAGALISIDVTSAPSAGFGAPLAVVLVIETADDGGSGAPENAVTEGGVALTENGEFITEG